MKDQVRALEETLRAQKNEKYLLEQEEEQNADWMWDVQRNYAKLEKDMADLDSRRLQSKSELLKSDEAQVLALRTLKKEEKYISNLELNGGLGLCHWSSFVAHRKSISERRNQQEIQKLDEFYNKYYQEKEQTYIHAKIVDSGITRQKKELNLTKLRKRHHVRLISISPINFGPLCNLLF